MCGCVHTKIYKEKHFPANMHVIGKKIVGQGDNKLGFVLFSLQKVIYVKKSQLPLSDLIHQFHWCVSDILLVTKLLLSTDG